MTYRYPYNYSLNAKSYSRKKPKLISAVIQCHVYLYSFVLSSFLSFFFDIFIFIYDLFYCSTSLQNEAKIDISTLNLKSWNESHKMLSLVTGSLLFSTCQIPWLSHSQKENSTRSMTSLHIVGVGDVFTFNPSPNRNTSFQSPPYFLTSRYLNRKYIHTASINGCNTTSFGTHTRNH